MSLTVTDARLDGEAVGLRVEDGAIVELGTAVGPRDGRRSDRRRGDGARSRPRQRPHPRRDDAVPGPRRRPAVDGVAPGGDLAGRGPARRRGRLLGDAAGLRGDDPDRHGPLLGHVLARRGHRARGRGRRAPSHDRRAPDRRGRRRRPEGASPRSPSGAWRRSARPGSWCAPALAPHAIYTVSEPSLRWIAEAPQKRELPVQIHLSETEEEVTRLRRRARRAARRVPGPARVARAANGAGPRRLAGRVRSWS